MALTAKELKEQMAIPPGSIPAAKPRDRKDRERNRIRLEITPVQCQGFIEMLGIKLRTMGSGHADFKELYTIYRALKVQMEKRSSK